GNAYGFITSTGHALDEKGNDVGMIDFYMQGKTYTLLERSSSTGAIGSYNSKSGLVRVTLNNGKITKVQAMYKFKFDGKIPSDKSGYPYTITQTGTDDIKNLHFYKVKDAGKTFAYYDDGLSEQGTYIGINNPCVVYTCKADGSDIEYEIGSNSDIAEGSYIAAFAIDKDSAGVADVVLVVDEDEAANLLTKVGGTNTAYAYNFK
ncbi:MAG: hypothetical protein MR576_06950, partial [Firmicutes bacterium]|nr:hypothetical protein [Bacillota bacterium]